jgi:hypothetical protein
MRSKPPLEKDTQNKILQWLKLQGIFAWTNKTQGTFDPRRGVFRASTQMVGIPDILGVLNDGRFLGIEVKRKPNKPTPEQVNFIQTASNLGAVCFVAYDLETVISEFDYIQGKTAANLAKAALNVGSPGAVTVSSRGGRTVQVTKAKE